MVPLFEYKQQRLPIYLILILQSGARARPPYERSRGGEHCRAGSRPPAIRFCDLNAPTPLVSWAWKGLRRVVVPLGRRPCCCGFRWGYLPDGAVRLSLTRPWGLRMSRLKRPSTRAWILFLVKPRLRSHLTFNWPSVDRLRVSVPMTQPVPAWSPGTLMTWWP